MAMWLDDPSQSLQHQTLFRLRGLTGRCIRDTSVQVTVAPPALLDFIGLAVAMKLLVN
jgi:hypothetical protein